MRIKPGHGYWDTTHYPIGGKFSRAGTEGKEVAEVLRSLQPRYKGCDIEVKFADGTTGSLDSNHTEGELHTP